MSFVTHIPLGILSSTNFSKEIKYAISMLGIPRLVAVKFKINFDFHVSILFFTFSILNCFQECMNI